jgi:signal transduction histidine kinase
MAWTTSACLRARPIAWVLAATRKTPVKYLVAALRRRLSRRFMPRWPLSEWHPNLAFALPLFALGFLAPLLPPTLTAVLLLSAGAALAIVTASAARALQPAPLGPRRTATHAPDAIAQRSPVPVAFQSSQIALQAPHLTAVRSAPRRPPRITRDPRDRNWAELMARVNHDLRTPLNAVIGFSELMVLELFGPLGDERYQDYAQHIRDSATDLLKSAEDTLALTALTANPNRRDGAVACDLEQLTTDAWAFVCRKAAARDIVFVPYIPPGLEVLGEQRTLRQILVNMLSEAVARAAYGERVVLAAVIEGELIELAVSVSKERAAQARKDGSLAICLARTLLEIQGTTLLEVNSTNNGWRAVTVLDRAVQTDFFKDRYGGQARENMAVLAS